MSTHDDRWSRWLGERRDGDDERQRAAILGHLAPVRDRVLAQAEPLAGATLLDVGTGDGLIGLEALERVGPGGIVIFSDISEALLERTSREVQARGLLERARFVQAGADDLAGIPDGSVDVVTTRSVLIYIADKEAALQAMHRVLRPGGRISLFEPINRLMSPEPRERYWGYDVAAVVDLADKVKEGYLRLADPASTSMTDFDDRDLVRLAGQVGFARIHLECHIDVEPSTLMRATSIDALLEMAPNPHAPTTGESIAAALTPAERERFVAHLAHEVEHGEPLRRSAVAYLAAGKAG